MKTFINSIPFHEFARLGNNFMNSHVFRDTTGKSMYVRKHPLPPWPRAEPCRRQPRSAPGQGGEEDLKAVEGCEGQVAGYFFWDVSRKTWKFSKIVNQSYKFVKMYSIYEKSDLLGMGTKSEPKGAKREPKGVKREPRRANSEPPAGPRVPRVSQGATRMHRQIELRKRSRKKKNLANHNVPSVHWFIIFKHFL